MSTATTSKINLVEELLLKNTLEIPENIQQHLHKLQRQTVDRPVIYIGSGTCGQVAGASSILHEVRSYLNENSIQAEVVETGCIGMCWAEPLMDIQLPGRSRLSHQNVAPENVTDILDATFNFTVESAKVLGQFKNDFTEPWEGISFVEDIPFYKNQTRRVLKYCGKINPYNLDEYIANGGFRALSDTLLSQTPAQIRDQVIKSGLRGRGGGGYLTGKKWETAAQSQGDQKYLICNADESDPGAFMDRAIIEGNPHLLIEGMALAAYATGISKSYVYIRSSYELAVERLLKAIDDCKEAGLLGHNILNSGFNFTIQLATSAGAFVCGEETALINSIEGKRGIPRPRPPYPSQRGLFNKPTVVNNVETLSNVPMIIGRGVDEFRSLGTKESPGTKVFSLSGKIEKPGLIEVPMGHTLKEIIHDIAGGIKNNKSFKAAQIGGPSGSCLVEENLQTPIDYESLSHIDAIMGSGGLVVADEDTCMVDLSKFFIGFLKDASCGKCIPCREGTHRMLEILEDITRKPQDSNHKTLDRFKGVMQLEELGKVISETSLCGLGQTAPKPVLSALKYFREEFEEHIYERKCRANVCRELRTYEIDPEACTGCTLCMVKCPEKAIIGAAKHPHFIIESKCTGCGICLEVCKFDAVKLK
jgi:NADH:ubiquinone oxidoreductase subunit F (NADH-binding)/(2Fe-2S) ferredoxin